MLGNFCSKIFPINCFPGLPDGGALQGDVPVWGCNSGQMAGGVQEN